MPIRSSQPPSQALDALHTGVAQLRFMPGAEAAEPRATSLARNIVQEGGEGVPHQVFHLGLDDVIAGKGLEAARASGWRFLMGQPSALTAVASEVHGGEGAQEFGGLTQGAQVAQMVVALQQAERLPEVRSGDFEPRLLRVPALYVVAVWLKERQSGKDILVPIPPSRPPLVLGRHYAAPEFESVLRDVAGAMKAPAAAPGQSAPSAP